MGKTNHSKGSIVEDFFLEDFHLAFIFKSAHRRKVKKGWSYHRHEHPVFELNMVVEGTQTFILKERNYEMSAGDIMFIKPDETHSCHTSSAEGTTYVCIHFGVDHPELRRTLCKIRDPLHRKGSPLWEEVYPLLMKIGLPETIGHGRGKEVLDNLSLCMDLISSLSRLLADPPPGLLGEWTRYDKLASQLADKIASLASEHSESNNDLLKQGIKRIARELGYHPAYCARIFKNIFGISPREYLSAIKIRESKLLLMDRKLNMEQIAARLGFRDASHFSKQFKRWTKLSPSEYRRKH